LSSAVFLPQTRAGGQSALSGLAAQFGLVLPLDQGESVMLYVQLLRSPMLLDSLAVTDFTPGDGLAPASGMLLDLFKIKGATLPLRREAAVRALSRAITVSFSRESGTVRFEVRARSPALARGVAVTTLELLNRFNLERRSQKGRAEREFVEGRVAAARDELRNAEDQYRIFLQENRSDFRASPRLAVEQDRLQREVTLRQQLYTTLSQAFEQARLEEIRNTPALTVVEEPMLPARPARRGTVAAGVVGWVAGFVVGLLVAMAREAVALSQAQSPAAYAEFEGLWRAAISDFRHPLQLLPNRVRRSVPRPGPPE
jgi:uncharacterized protein involved in exopolysaccharide biosynthesis